jgi:Dolichyl-phosphate-mannose-protein mannosyltransferase
MTPCQERTVRPKLDRVEAWLSAWRWAYGGAAVLIVIIGLTLRLYRSTALSLWLDEGFTVYFARLPWDAVLGLHGAYDSHPPLYYSVVKAVSLFLPEAVAGRYLSVFAGAATVGVVSLLVARIAGRPAALMAGLVAATSPLLVWYSQEARQYALTGLAVSLAYLALVSFHYAPRNRWAVLYCLTVLAAAYLDYSALYALLPQVLLLPFVVRRHGRRALPLIIGGTAAVVAYVPWIPQVLGTVHALGASRGSYLGADLGSVAASALSITGFGGQGIYYYSPWPAPWERWSSLDVLMAALAITGIGLGAAALARDRFALAVASALLVGTVLSGAAISQVSPGFAPRTVSYAVLGWALLLGAAVGGGRIRLARRTAGAVAIAAIVALSGQSLRVQYHGDKEHWREWAGAVSAAAGFGYPMVVFPTIAPTLLDTYQPGAVPSRRLNLEDTPDLQALDAFAAGRPVIWVASYDIPAVAAIDRGLRAQGMVPAVSEHWVVLLSLNLYVRPGVSLGTPVEVNGGFTGPGNTAMGWFLTAEAASIQDDTGGRVLTLSSTGGAEASAVLRRPGMPNDLYLLTFDARSRLTSGSMRAFLICEGQGGMLQVAPNESGADVPTGGGWQTVSIGVVCPAGTDQVRIDLRNAGAGELDLRSVRLDQASPSRVGT